MTGTEVEKQKDPINSPVKETDNEMKKKKKKKKEEDDRQK